MPALTTPICDFGRNAIAFELEGVDGETYSLADIAGPKGALIIFLCNHCPYVKAIIGRLAEDARTLMAEGVGVIGVMPNDTEAYPADSFDNMKLFAAENALPFPYVIDRTQEVARAYDAVCTPDFFGYNADLKLQYRGRLDESRTRLIPDARRDLVEAMRQIAATGAGPQEQIASMGCSIKWREAA